MTSIWCRRLAVVLCLAVLSFASLASAQQLKLKAYSSSAPATDAGGHAMSAAQAAASSDLTTFTYTVLSSRDGNTYSGAMVGQNPFGSSFTTTSINTPIIPVILTTNSVFVKLTNGGAINTKPGLTVFDPTVADDACFSSPNDVPLTLMAQSPEWRSARQLVAHFTAGGSAGENALDRLARRVLRSTLEQVRTQ
jgi:hypothetical protein